MARTCFCLTEIPLRRTLVCWLIKKNYSYCGVFYSMYIHWSKQKQHLASLSKFPETHYYCLKSQILAEISNTCTSIHI